MESNFEKFDDREPELSDEYDQSTIYVENGGRFELVATETMNTFGPEDEDRMAKEGLVVLPVAWGQNVYRYIEGDAL